MIAIRRRSRERGQGLVEFVLFLVALFLMLFLMLQLMWFAVQKWQFNHFGSYAARVWTVDKKDRSPETMLLQVQALALNPWRWRLAQSDYVKVMWASSPTSNDGISGIRYTGWVRVWHIYRPFFGGIYDLVGIPSGIPYLDGFLSGLPTTGLLQFKTFVPMEREPKENPDRWDNDCSDPCNDNKR